MILKKEMLTKSLKKGRTTAVALLNELSKSGGLPAPHYEYRPGGSVKKRSHYYKVRFRVPQFLEPESSVVVGSGKATKKSFAMSLAALEVVHRLEEELGEQRGNIQKRLDDYVEAQRKKQEELEAVPVEKELPGVSWDSMPIDPSFAETQPATRRGRIEFFPALIENDDAFTAAKAITLACEERLPEVEIHANQTDIGVIQRWANIRTFAGVQAQMSIRKEANMGISNQEAEILALEHVRSVIRKQRKEKMVNLLGENESFGMAKLFVKLPTHQFSDLKELLQRVEDSPVALKVKEQRTSRRGNAKVIPETCESELKSRLESFRAHQLDYPLPIDSIETDIPYSAPVTVIQGGTGSGKTTRYPLMLSLLSRSDSTRVMVAQPRRLACQTAARRVAYEQGFELGSKSCPIGYQIRFESRRSSGTRTVDFATPGVLLRQAMDDPLFRDVTHLVIDEVHERNADVDLLLALAKQAVERRANHTTLPPLSLVLMSATLDSTLWEKYLGDTKPVVVDVPEVRRFPIDIVHLDEAGFPRNLKSLKLLRKEGKQRKKVDSDEALCEVMAELALRLFDRHDLDGGSILCFLPGMDEIRLVDRHLRQQSRNKRGQFTVRVLHSSLSSQEQAKVFRPGPKIILATNIAETSLTIPDVKIVIDSGRERQHSILGSSSSSETTTVVGSQLLTVNISQASAKQRAGRAGRVSAGTCYRLYTRRQLENEFSLHTLPEMLRMELSQIVLHSLSVYHPSSGHSLDLLLNTPNPPTEARLRQTLRGLSSQGLLEYVKGEDLAVSLTPLGQAVSSVPVTPRLGRMLFAGLMLRSIEPAVRIASLLSVPKVFSSMTTSSSKQVCSDVLLLLEEYQEYLRLETPKEDVWMHPKGRLFEQVRRVERQLGQSMMAFVGGTFKNESGDQSWAKWNANSDRVGALAGLICSATPHIAHLVAGKSMFSTRDIAGRAKIHPSSVNFSNERRVHWYVYNELRSTRQPYMHVTTAVSPLELALFAEASGLGNSDDDDGLLLEYQYQQHKNFLFVADQWVPVELSKPSQRETFLKLRRLVMHDMMQQVAEDPRTVLTSPHYERIVMFVLSAVEQQRLRK